MGPSRVDPRTGQILDADIIFDDSMIRAWIGEFDHFSPANAVRLKGEPFRKWLEQRPERLRRFGADVEVPETPLQKALATLKRNGHANCNVAEGLRQQITLAHHAMLATAAGKELPERFFGEVIRETVAHEVGHTLGLRHNFKASSWLKLDEIRKRRLENDEATTASVMDYNPILFFAEDDLKTVRHFTTPTIGPYDHWAIEYGYSDAAEGKSEEEHLQAVAGRCTEAGLDYATDEDTLWVISPDPHVFRWDMSSDPIAWTQARKQLCDHALSNIRDWAAKKGEERRWLRQAFAILTFERARNYELIGKLIGGQSFNRDHIGDPGARPAFQIVPPDLQRAALEELGKTLFSEDFFQFDADLLNDLAPSRWDHWGSWAPSRLDYPIHEEISAAQWYTLVDITSEDVLQRVYDAELKSADPNRFTAAELVTRTRDLVWRQLDAPRDGKFTNTNPFISSVGRSLHREYLDLILTTVQWGPGWGLSPDLHAMLGHAMRELSAKIGVTLGAKWGENLDFASRAHLTECKSRIDRVLAAQFRAN